MAKPIRAVAVVAVGALGLAACASGSGTDSGSGSGSAKTVIVSTDLPLQGSNKDASDSTNNAIELYLKGIGNKVGNYTIQFQKYDNSTAAAAKWDQAQCQANAQKHVANKNEVAVMGTLNSGCAKIEVPVLNQAPDGPLLMVSHANTNVGLTRQWDAGEPNKYYPTSKRNYARVVTTDDVQGAAAAIFAGQTLGVKKCYILNDNETYGQGVAKVFQENAAKNGITVLGNEAWDPKATNYTALFQKVQAAGADCVFLGGIYDAGGAQLVKDKVSVLGDNEKVKLIAPDGFTGFPDLNKSPQAQGMYLTFAGLSIDQLLSAGGAGAKLVEDYKKQYGKAPSSNYALYGVAALQVILKAIEKSDGTRKGVVDQVFSGAGISIGASESVLGKDLKIDPATGDVNAKDITVEVIKGQAETFLKAQSVQ
ncbi:MAG TPA: branched-chain amino acid ABC transporter substrate-binding protein [Kineosporiaceae bacterium]|nr:branched-chain amino acid ABC transporter substrate-binding protein [Kineosporiaceae bacterium]